MVLTGLFKRVRNRTKKSSVIHNRSSSGLWTGTQHNDDELFSGIDIGVLPKDANCLKCATMDRISLWYGPPKITIVDGFATDNLRTARFFKPAIRYKALSVDYTILLNH